jgi:cobalt-zinc-cadmium efflux system outer membrane protein|tara:strand:+ start:4820 stop:6070 length:1251 start_codon:yes stop_codon:yes gene_type:complete
MKKYLIRARMSLLIVLCSFSAGSFAENQSRFTLKKALQLTLEHNPKLTRYPLYIRQIEGEIQQANSLPSPMAEIELSNNETRLTLSQSFELGNKRQNRRAFSNAKQQQLHAEFTIIRLDVLAETSRRYYQLLALQKQQSLQNIRIGQEKRALKIIKKRAQAGIVSQADVANMALRLARSNTTLKQLQFSIEGERIRLASMWLNDGSELKNALGKLSQLPKLPTEEQLSLLINKQLEQLPDYRLQVALLRLADNQLQLEQANSRADINLGLGISHDQNTHDPSLVFTAAMPLNFMNVSGAPNRGRINSALAQQQLSLDNIDIKRRELRIELARIQQALAKDRYLEKQITSQLLPLASEVLSTTQKAYRQGQYTVRQWIDAQGQVFNLEQDLINSQVRIFNQVLELERILGQSIVSAQ